MNKKIKTQLSIFVTILITFLAFLLLLGFLLERMDQGFIKGYNLGKDVGILGIFTVTISLTAFISIIFSLQKNRDDRYNELQQTTIDLFRELRGPNIRNARDKSWEINEKWDLDANAEGFRPKFIEAMFSGKVVPEENVTKEHVQAVYDLIGFYTMLSLYRGNDEFIQELNYFYYGWWRKFLYDLSVSRDA